MRPRGKINKKKKKTAKIKRKRICRFCENRERYIDYKNEKKLTRFTSERGKIVPRRISGTCTKHQRQLVRAIKRARHLAMLPFVVRSAA